MASASISEVGAAAVASEFGATKVSFHGKFLSPDEVSAIFERISTDKVEEMDFAACQLKAEGALVLSRNLTRCPRLRSLIVRTNEIGEEALVGLCKVLEGCESLRHVDFSYETFAGMSSLALSQFLRKNLLTSLDIHYCRFSAMSEIAKALRDCSSMREINLSYTCADESVLTALPDGITTLNLSSTGLSREALSTLCLTTLEFLDINSNKTGGAEAAALAKVIEQNPSLKELNLFGCDIGASGVAILGAALEGAGNLKKLNLHANELGDKGVIVTLGHLPPDIEELNLEHNRATDGVISALKEAILASSSLRLLNITSNSISSDTLKEFAGWVKVNRPGLIVKL